jgi:hypothetical protein
MCGIVPSLWLRKLGESVRRNVARGAVRVFRSGTWGKAADECPNRLRRKGVRICFHLARLVRNARRKRFGRGPCRLGYPRATASERG